jgi:hypothetical protein
MIDNTASFPFWQALCVVSIPAAVTGGFALLAIWLGNRKTRRDVADRVGTPNGHGDLIQMVTSLHQRQDRQDRRADRMSTRLGRIEKRTVAIEKIVNPPTEESA